MLNFKYSETQEMIRETAMQFAQVEIAPSVIDRDISCEFPKEIIQKMGDLGFMGMMVSPEYGRSSS